MSDSLPKYTEHVVEVPMSDIPDEKGNSQRSAYLEFEDKLVNAVRKALVLGDKSLPGALVQSLPAYPYGSRRGETIWHPHRVNLLPKNPNSWHRPR